MYKLRPEQQRAVDQTYQYWQRLNATPNNPTENAPTNALAKPHISATHQFLWNAKPRFGKTLAAYDFAQRIHARRILIVTNRPAVSDSWARDFFSFIAPSSDYIFAAAKPHALATNATEPQHATKTRPPKAKSANSPRTPPHIYSRSELLRQPALLNRPLIFFISLQDIKGQITHDAKARTSQNAQKAIKLHTPQPAEIQAAQASFKAKNRWIFDLEKGWDLLIIDEGHEGIKTSKTAAMLKNLKASFTLYLSGTPFRALADQDFSADQIFNWTYLDEQKSYPDRPRLDFRVCQFSATPLTGPWLDQVAQLFQTLPNLRHTFWLLSTINDCKSLQKSLAAHPYFREYRVATVVGSETSGPKALAKVRPTIGPHPEKTRTITLSCGQLTTGITIPEWSAVFMLYNSQDLTRLSSSQYLQAAFRAQTPAVGKRTAYIFDFLPDRALTALQDYAQNLCNLPPASALPELLQHLDVTLCTIKSAAQPAASASSIASGPVLTFTPLNSSDIVALPSQFIAREIVESGFASANRLFNLDQLSAVSAPAERIIAKLSALHKNRLEKSPARVSVKDLQSIDSLATTESAIEDITEIAGENAAKTTTAPVSEPINPRRAQVSLEDRYRDKLRGFSRTIPLLLHLYGEPDSTLATLVEQTPDHIFKDLTNITKSEFSLLCREGYLNELNYNLAIREFMRRESDLAAYYAPSVDRTIFDFIPLQYHPHVFTPQSTAELLIEKLQSSSLNYFRSLDATFFDPSAKSGLTLALVVRTLFQNLRPHFPSDRACLLHILTHQIYAWSPDEITHRTVLRTLLAATAELGFTKSELATISQHLQLFDPQNGTSGISLAKVKQHLNQTWEKNMKFDVIISNPPYQLGRRQVYADFYKLAVDLDPELLCMVFPQGWQKPHNHNGLGQLNNTKYKRDPHLASIDNYDRKSAEKLFPNVGTGALNIVFRDRNFDNHGHIPQLLAGQPTDSITLPLSAADLPKPPELTPLIEQFKYLPKIESLGSARKPYGFYADPLRHPEKYHLELQTARQREDDVRLFGLLDDVNRGFRYIPRASLPKISPNLDRYKLFVPKAWGNMSTRIGLGGSFSNICLASPGDACSETFIEFGPFATRAEATRAAKYFMTKFFRALLFLAKTSQNTAKDKYRFVPLPDFHDPIWQSKISTLDQKLFELYDVPPATRDFILQNFQPRDESNIEIL